MPAAKFQRMICRDLKPENFLLATKNKDSDLKATDFGLSMFYKPGQTFTDIVGSAYYVAPEVNSFPTSQDLFDIVSFGVLLLRGPYIYTI